MKIDINKFDGTRDFHIWRCKISVLLAQKKLINTLKAPIPLQSDFLNDQRAEMIETTTGIISFHLSDSIIRMVDKVDTPAKIWKKLDVLFQSKYLTNKTLLKEKLFEFNMNNSISIDRNLDAFLRMTLEQSNSGENDTLSGKNQSIIILNSLSEA